MKMGFIGACLSLVGVLPAATNITENVTLSEDTDWRGQGQVTVALGVSVNLNGHKLQVAGLDCAGTIMNVAPKFRYFRFKIDANRGGTPMCQIGELKLFDGETDITDQRTALHWNDATYPSQFKPGYTPDKAFDSNLDTEWFDNRLTGSTIDDIWVVIEYAEPMTVTKYQWWTGIDTDNQVGRNPTAWRLQGSNDNSSWTDLAVVSGNFDCPVQRKTIAFTGALNVNAPSLDLDLAAGGAFSLTGTCSVPVQVLSGTLQADVDLRSFGDQLDFTGPICLNGHRLSLAALTGTEEIANVPPAYRRLAYIESTGTQWIDTGFVTTDQTAIDFDFTVLTDNGNTAYFCGDWAAYGHLFVVNGNNINFFGSGNKVGTYAANTHLRLQTIPGGDKTVILYNGDTGAELGSSNIALTHSGSDSMHLFAAGDDGSKPVNGYRPASYRLHSFKLTHQGTVVRDLVPVERSADGKGGLYDLANNVFYPSTGSEDFVKGPRVGEGLGFDDNGTAGELYLEVAADEEIENETSACIGNVRFTKAGAGGYIERRVQSNTGGLKLEAGSFAFDLDEPLIDGTLTFAGGSLVVEEGQPITVTGGASVTAPSGIVFRRGAIAGKKTAIVNFGASVSLSQLTLTVTPAIDCEKSMTFAGDDLQVVLGGANDVVKAVWSGATDGDVTKPGNWYCTNAEEAQVANGLPAAYTTIYIGGSVAMQAPVGAGLAYGTLQLDDCTLTADCDWRGLGVLPVAGTIDLAGHKLYTAGVDGPGKVTSGDVNGYRFYRFKVDATGGSNLQISEIRLYAGDLEITGSRKALHWNTVGAYNGYYPDKAFDGNTGTKWFDNRSANDTWVTVEYENPVFMTRYAWVTGDDTQKYSDRNPTAWRLQGSNDNSAWTDLHVVTGQTPPAQNKVDAGIWLVDPNQGGDGSELHIEVTDGAVQNLATVTLANRLKLVKDGAGTLVLSKIGQTFGGGIEIAAGYLKPGQRDDSSIFGGGCATITVDEGAQFLDDLFCRGATSDIGWFIAGTGPDGSGAIRATVRTPDKNNALVAWGRSLTLLDDATIGNDEYAWDFLAPNYKPYVITFNNHTVTLKSAKVKSARQYPFFLASSMMGADAGTIHVGENLQFYPYQTDAGVLPNATLVISEQAEYGTGTDTNGRDFTVSNLVYRSSSSMSQTSKMTYVLGRYSPESTTSAPKVQLGDADHLAPQLDVSARAGAYDIAFGGGLTFFAGSTVGVDMGNRPLAQMEKVLAWSAPPANVSFKCLDRKGELVIREDGLYYMSGLMVIIR